MCRHSCDGSATITSTEKVTFPNNKVTDTFFYYGTLVVTDALQSYDLTPTPTGTPSMATLFDLSPSSIKEPRIFRLGSRFFGEL